MGTLALWTSPLLRAGQQGAGGTTALTDRIALLDAGGSNVVAFNTGEGFILVDTGVPKSSDRLLSVLKGASGTTNVQTVFNTHYHLDQTGNNEVFTGAGARVIAHDRTRQWMSVDYWLPDQDRYEK